MSTKFEKQVTFRMVHLCGGNEIKGEIVGKSGERLLVRVTDGQLPNNAYEYDTLIVPPEFIVKSPKTYSIKQKFVDSIYEDQILMLCQTETKKVCAMPVAGWCLANRWRNPIFVGDVNNITEEEFQKIIWYGDRFRLVEE